MATRKTKNTAAETATPLDPTGPPVVTPTPKKEAPARPARSHRDQLADRLRQIDARFPDDCEDARSLRLIARLNFCDLPADVAAEVAPAMRDRVARPFVLPGGWGTLCARAVASLTMTEKGYRQYLLDSCGTPDRATMDRVLCSSFSALYGSFPAAGVVPTFEHPWFN